jgi:hypothetical protein
MSIVLFVLYYLLPWFFMFFLLKPTRGSFLDMLIPGYKSILLFKTLEISSWKAWFFFVVEYVFILIPFTLGLIIRLPGYVVLSISLIGWLIGSEIIFFVIFEKVVRKIGFNPCAVWVNILYFVFPFVFFPWLVVKKKKR